MIEYRVDHLGGARRPRRHAGLLLLWNRKTGKVGINAEADAWRFEGGKAVEFYEYFDTAQVHARSRDRGRECLISTMCPCRRAVLTLISGSQLPQHRLRSPSRVPICITFEAPMKCLRPVFACRCAPALSFGFLHPWRNTRSWKNTLTSRANGAGHPVPAPSASPRMTRPSRPAADRARRSRRSIRPYSKPTSGTRLPAGHGMDTTHVCTPTACRAPCRL